jgi:AraC-like DNA-binding protein
VKDGRDCHYVPSADLPELVLVGRTEIQQPLPRLEVPFAPGCCNLYLGFKGSKQMQAEGRTYSLNAGEFFLTPPGVEHTTGPMPISRCAHYWLRIDLTGSAAFLGNSDHEPLRRGLANSGIVNGRYREDLLTGVRAVYALCAGTKTAARDARWLLEMRLQLGLTLLRLLDHVEHDTPSPSDDPVLAEVVAHIDRHLGESLSLPDLASVARCSVSALQSLFKRSEGLSPGEFVTRRRMQAAEELLLAGTLSLREIAERLGFANERHFSNAFRRFHGEPPGRFRASRGS